MSVNTTQLAELCRVSLGTVDRALRNRPGINPETRQRILEMAKLHGYKPNLVARNLKLGKTNEIGLVLHDLENEFFSELTNQVQEIAWRHNYYVQLAITRRDSARERLALEHMAERRVDGIILFPTCSGNDFSSFLRSLDRPIMTIGNKVDSSWPFVGLRDRSVISELVEGIISKGYRRLFFVGPLANKAADGNLYEIEERYAGFVETIESHHGIQQIVLSEPDYVEQLARVDFSSERSAIVCVSDIFALEILRDLRRRGLSVPGDVGLVGFDSIHALRYIVPALATVEYPIHEMASIAFSKILEKTKESLVPFIELDPVIHWGESL
jgi:DNA-binding LacI/PurR family transcriptional regulator